MNDFPDFSEHGYCVVGELGHNRAGGRVTYVATDVRTQEQVVIKQFQFAKVGSTWSSFDTYDREIQLLTELNHPGIPRYLNSFQTPDGFCMVQEYKQAESLATSRSYDPNEIRQIAIAALEVLVYLQNRIPPVIHRDVKPENILIDQAGRVYLVDFGFARVGEGEVGVSSVVKGTLGFMPPEQLFNRQLTDASDLYGLGMTLICLLTGTKSDNIGDLVDISYRVSFKQLIPKLNQQWVNWLEKMVESRLKDRFPNAVSALGALPASPLRPPEAQFSQSSLEFEAKYIGEVLAQNITIMNPIPGTTLAGSWELAPHPHDPQTDLYSWITISPTVFTDNHLQFEIVVDTHRLMSGKIYHRQLLLHTNTLIKTYSLNLNVRTASSPQSTDGISYSLISLLAGFFLGFGWLTGWLTIVVGSIAGSTESATVGLLVGGAIGMEGAAWLMRSSGWQSEYSTFLAALLGAMVMLQVLFGLTANMVGIAVLIGAGIGILSGVIAGIAINISMDRMLEKNHPKLLAILLTLSTALFGTCLGFVFSFGPMHQFLLSTLVISAIVLVILLVQVQLQRINTRSNHRKSQRFLIKP